MENIKEKVEDKIIDFIALGAQGRLVAFKPEKSDKDLVIEKRADYKKKTISLNIYNRKTSTEDNLIEEVKQLVSEREIKPEKDFFLLFVYFDAISQKVNKDLFFIPSLDLGALQKTGDALKYLTDKEKLITFLLERFEDNKYKKK